MPDQSSAATEHALMQEITAPLETLPDDPLALVEADFPTSMRGYDRHAVDAYVQQMSRLVSELHSTRSPEAAVRKALARVGDQITGILQRAHQTAEQITAQSRAEAEDRVEQARREAAAIVDAAEQRVRELDADADRIWGERQRIIADAEDLSAQLLGVARDASGRFPSAPAQEVLDGDAGVLQAPGLEQSDAPEPPTSSHPAWDPTDPDEDEPETGLKDDPPITAAEPLVEPTEPYRPVIQDDATRVIPPSSDAAQTRDDA